MKGRPSTFFSAAAECGENLRALLDQLEDHVNDDPAACAIIAELNSELRKGAAAVGYRFLRVA